MKRLLIFSLVIVQFTATAQEKDSLVNDWNNRSYEIYKKANQHTYYLKKDDKIVLKGLKFVASLRNSIQVIDENNEMFFLDDSLEKTTNPDNQFFVCGTVPHYELEIKSKGNHYYVYEDETFYDGGNKIPAEVTKEIPKRDADKVYFINKEMRFNFSSNYGIGEYAAAPPRTIIFEKDGKKGIWDETAAIYDEITVRNNALILEKDKLYGYFGINDEVKYSKLGEFNFYLAPIEFPDGTKGWLDTDGKEYTKK